MVETLQTGVYPPTGASHQTDQPGPSTDADLWERRIGRRSRRGSTSPIPGVVAATGRLPGPLLEDAASARRSISYRAGRSLHNRHPSTPSTSACRATPSVAGAYRCTHPR